MAEEKKSKVMLIGGLIVGLILLAALAVGGTLYFLDTKKDDESAEEVVVKSSKKGLKSGSYYFTFDDAFVVPLVSSDRRQRMLQISLAVKTQNAQVALAMEKHMPLLRHKLNSLLTKQDYQTLQTPEGKLQLQMSAYAEVQEVMQLENMQVDEVLITDFVMQ